MISHFASAKHNLECAIELIDAIEKTNTPEQIAIRNDCLIDYYDCLEAAMRHIEVALYGVNQ